VEECGRWREQRERCELRGESGVKVGVRGPHGWVGEGLRVQQRGVVFHVSSVLFRSG
jgi:hypothetical protein